MNVKRFTIATIVVFIYIFFFEWIFHGIILRDIYMATQSLWRSQVDVQAHFIWMLIGQFLMALMFCFIFTRGYEAKGLPEGIRYGFYIALLLLGPHLVMYAVQPFPGYLQFVWAVGGLVEFIIAGILVAAIYKR